MTFKAAHSCSSTAIRWNCIRFTENLTMFSWQPIVNGSIAIVVIVAKLIFYHISENGSRWRIRMRGLDIWFWSDSQIKCEENIGNILHFMEVKMYDARKWYELLGNCYVWKTTWNKRKCHRPPKYSTFNCTQNILSRKNELPIFRQ